MADCEMAETVKQNTAQVGDRRKSKSEGGRRRSSFAPGRKSLLDVARKEDLHQQIPNDFPPSDRLNRLVRLGLQQTLEAMQKEMGEVPGFETFNSEAMLSVETVIDAMEADGTFNKACEMPGTVPNPVNLQMDATIGELTRSIQRMEREDKDWDSLLHRLQNQSQEAEKKLDDLSVESSELGSDVQELAKAYLGDAPDVSTIIHDVEADLKTISLFMEEYKQTVDTLREAQLSVQHHHKRAASSLGIGCSDVAATPRKIIKLMVSDNKYLE